MLGQAELASAAILWTVGVGEQPGVWGREAWVCSISSLAPVGLAHGPNVGSLRAAICLFTHCCFPGTSTPAHPTHVGHSVNVSRTNKTSCTSPLSTADALRDQGKTDFSEENGKKKSLYSWQTTCSVEALVYISVLGKLGAPLCFLTWISCYPHHSGRDRSSASHEGGQCGIW